MSEPLVLNGFRICKRCAAVRAAKVGWPRVWGTPMIYNRRSNINHLNPSKRDLSTLCGLETKSDSWQLPWREMERREKIQSARWMKRWEEERLEREALLARHGIKSARP